MDPISGIQWLAASASGSFDYTDFGLEIVFIGIYAYFIYFLLQPPVLVTFQVNANRKKQTLITGIIAALLLNILVRS